MDVTGMMKGEPETGEGRAGTMTVTVNTVVSASGMIGGMTVVTMGGVHQNVNLVETGLGRWMLEVLKEHQNLQVVPAARHLWVRIFPRI